VNEPKKILVVDDELLNRKVLEGLLRAFGYAPVMAESGKKALELLDPSFDLVLLDIMMPGMDGFAVAREIRANSACKDAPIIVVTALSSIDDRLKAVEAGANDYITKPIDKAELRVRTASMLRMKAAQDEIKRYQAELEDRVRVRTEALQLAVENLQMLQQATQHAHLETIHCLSYAAEYKDEDTAQHIHRMSRYSALLATTLGLPEREVQLILNASPMHDVGKIGIPDAILLKPGKLDPVEWEIMKEHSKIGAKILEQSTAELLQVGAIIAYSHHEKWDGSGYPEGLAGEDIPLYGRICAISDVFDALISRRPYKEPFSVERSLEIMKEGRGAHFDPVLLDLFLKHFDKILEIKERFSD
jgi:putative two-component system response regulator